MTRFSQTLDFHLTGLFEAEEPLRGKAVVLPALLISATSSASATSSSSLAQDAPQSSPHPFVNGSQRLRSRLLEVSIVPLITTLSYSRMPARLFPLLRLSSGLRGSFSFFTLLSRISRRLFPLFLLRQNLYPKNSKGAPVCPMSTIRVF